MPCLVADGFNGTVSAASGDLLGKGGPGVLPWRGLGNPAWGAGNPQISPFFPKGVSKMHH